MKKKNAMLILIFQGNNGAIDLRQGNSQGAAITKKISVKY
jgi:hypothetical protein